MLVVLTKRETLDCLSHFKPFELTKPSEPATLGDLFLLISIAWEVLPHPRVQGLGEV